MPFHGIKRALKLESAYNAHLFSSFKFCRSDRVNFKQEEEISNKGIDDVVTTLKTDYDHAYFVTGTILWFIL